MGIVILNWEMVLLFSLNTESSNKYHVDLCTGDAANVGAETHMVVRADVPSVSASPGQPIPKPAYFLKHPSNTFMKGSAAAEDKSGL